ncbi:hypothetical protein BDV95DRAFT_572254 [Massariosphaeria phaeospora]|uniref:Secreted protein n=1 Tax=Massariosphaeria phaeospora TaxID=100035 RepID=A0A7C8MNY1_9PLEO|nr:hypothetical protein BDV95DRAFT_572254 [Massariosphaeria phaeospora]
MKFNYLLLLVFYTLCQPYPKRSSRYLFLPTLPPLRSVHTPESPIRFPPKSPLSHPVIFRSPQSTHDYHRTNRPAAKTPQHVICRLYSGRSRTRKPEDTP